MLPFGPGMAPLMASTPFSTSDGNDGEVQRGVGHMTHAASHTLALEDTARGGACANRARTTLVLVRAVGTTMGLEAPTLDGACRSPCPWWYRSRRPGCPLPGTAQRSAPDPARTLRRYRCGPQRGDDAGDASLGEVAGKRLGHLGRVNLAVAKLNSLVAVGLFGLDSSHHVGGDVNEGHRNEETVLVPDLETCRASCPAVRCD